MTQIIRFTAESPAVSTLPRNADAQLVAMWLHGRPATTQEAYASEYRHLRRFTATPLPSLGLAELQAFADSLVADGLAPATRGRKLSAVKSLLKFGHKLGVLPFDVGGMIRLPRLSNELAQRILPEASVMRVIELEPSTRNRTLLRLLYASGGRVSEICGLKWKHVQERDDRSGQIEVLGKGQRTRFIFLPASVFTELLSLRAAADDEAPVFRSRQRAQNGHLNRMRVLQIVQAAARRAGIKKAVSPHWFRHAHASHSLDRGAPVHLVASTLGHASIATTGHYAHAKPKDSSARYLAV